jgi:hypothetical protein
LKKEVSDNNKKLNTHELAISKLETKQASIIKHDQAVEQKNNDALKKKIAGLDNV